MLKAFAVVSLLINGQARVERGKMMKKITKLYAAYKAGYLGNNILDTYFALIANIILEKRLMVIEDTAVASEFKERYQVELPLLFIRQILGVGVKNRCFIEDHGKYSVAIEKLSQYRFSDTDFNEKWEQLVRSFEAYYKEKTIDFSSVLTSDFILDILDKTDDVIFTGDTIDDEQSTPPMEYAWYSFVKSQAETQTDLYAFIAAVSASNITRQALFFDGETKADYSDLHVYLDSPIVFALLGMDSTSRTDAYKTLISDMLKVKCNVHVLDHNFQEVDGIIARAAAWANSTAYDLRKANNVARFFHDSQMSDEEITEFCESIESKLNDFGITVKKTNYDVFQDKFQEDEKCLFDMVKDRYLEHGYELLKEKEESIRIDVRSIIMVYRERQGQTATRLQNAKHIMLTSNNAIANVSKKYESNRSIQAGHIPACISADLFGAVLWLNSPFQMQEYQKKKLLADCYAFLKPNRILLDKYIQSLDEARASDKIEEKTFLFLRTHKVVLDSLMDITQGDYARFNSSTYLEVYEDIQSKAHKQYRDEVASHKRTLQELEDVKAHEIEESKETSQTIRNLRNRVRSLEDEKRHSEEKKINRWGWFVTLVVAGIPYFILIVGIEIVKTNFADISWKSAYGIAGTIIATAIAGVIYAKAKQWCFRKVRQYFQKHKNANDKKDGN